MLAEDFHSVIMGQHTRFFTLILLILGKKQCENFAFNGTMSRDSLLLEYFPCPSTSGSRNTKKYFCIRFQICRNVSQVSKYVSICSELHELAKKSKLFEVFRRRKENLVLHYLAKSRTQISNVSTNSIRIPEHLKRSVREDVQLN
jgi:hypothetical protein